MNAPGICLPADSGPPVFRYMSRRATHVFLHLVRRCMSALPRGQDSLKLAVTGRRYQYSDVHCRSTEDRGTGPTEKRVCPAPTLLAIHGRMRETGDRAALNLRRVAPAATGVCECRRARGPNRQGAGGLARLTALQSGATAVIGS